MAPQLGFTVHPNGHGVILTVDGEVDLATAPQLHAKLTDLVDNTAVGVVVDLTPVAFMDSTGITVLLAGRKRAHARGHSIQLVCPEGPVLRVLRTTGVDTVVPVHSVLAEAVSAQTAAVAAD
jgi:anti-sigma B factor antagonist